MFESQKANIPAAPFLPTQGSFVAALAPRARRAVRIVAVIFISAIELSLCAVLTFGSSEAGSLDVYFLDGVENNKNVQWRRCVDAFIYSFLPLQLR